MTDVTANAIGITVTDGTYHVYVPGDDRLSWPDGISAGQTTNAGLDPHGIHGALG